MANKENIHGGHRQRLKNRFLEDGLKHFEDHQILELLLFYCIPRQDTNPIAHALLDHFGSLAQVMEAPASELKKVPGVGDSVATFLALINAYYRHYDSRDNPNEIILDDLNKCGEFLKRFYRNRRNETVYMLCLDAKCKLLCYKEVGEGSVNSAAVPIRRIVEIALGANATSVILAHNHPSGLALPSPEDQLTTKQLAYALSAVDIILADHMVFADKDFISMRHSGMYHPNDCRLLI